MREKIYDGEQIFKAWCSWGAAATGTRLREYAKSQFGGTSQMGAEYSMWKWAFLNPEDAFPFWKNWYFEKYPERGQPTFEDFTKVLLSKARANQNVGGSIKKIERFCKKYGIEVEIRVKHGDVIQVTRQNHPLFQALLIVERVDGNDISAFLINDDSSCSEFNFTFGEIALIGQAIFERKQEIVSKGNISRIPVLEGLARDLWIPLKRIEVEDGVQKKYRFVYRDKRNEQSVVYFDFDEGVNREVSRLGNLLKELGDRTSDVLA